MSHYSWIYVVGIGLITGIGLIVGSVLGVYSNLKHSTISRIMSLGAGMLMSAAIVELVIEIFNDNPKVVSFAIIFGSMCFSFGNFLLSKFSAANRKRCGECIAQPNEIDNPGSGIAIALGTVMDAVPESLVLGMVLKSQGVSIPLIAAITIGNAPEAISSSSGMKSAGRSVVWIFSLWLGLALASGALTLVGYELHELLNKNFVDFIQAFGAGAILSMISEVLLPEASHDAPPFGGLIVASGFIGILLFGFFA